MIVAFDRHTESKHDNDPSEGNKQAKGDKRLWEYEMFALNKITQTMCMKSI